LASDGASLINGAAISVDREAAASPTRRFSYVPPGGRGLACAPIR